MGKNTSISWCHHTLNAWWGCSKVSPGCNNCYAAAFDHRLGGDHWQLKGPRRFFSDAYWAEPLKWAKAARASGERRRVFCSSMADVFEDRRDLDVWRDRLWDLIEKTPELDWLLLTKRPENLNRMLPWVQQPTHAKALAMNADVIAKLATPWPNVWLGTTVENQEYADRRIPLLLAAPAALRFLSLEPLLERVDLGWYLDRQCSNQHGDPLLSANLGWVIAGCESGHGARACDVEWLRLIRDQCAAARVPYLLKQAEWVPPITIGIGSKSKGRGHSTDILELPYLDGVQHAAFPVAA